ncbi:MAG: DUF7134 domain-containing protein, partial [Spirillospora sp.]
MRAPDWWPPRGRTGDLLLTAGCAVVTTGSVLTVMERYGRGPMPWYGWLLLAITCGALYFRRSHPVAVAIVTFAACAVYYPVTKPDGPVVITFVVALYTVAATGHLVVAGVLVSLSITATLYGDVVGDTNHLADAAGFLLAGWFVAVVAVGGVVRNRRAYLREAE